MNTFRHLRCLAALLALAATTSDAADLPVLAVPDWQPFAAQVRRVSEALTLAGAPLSAKERAELEKALLEKEPQKARARTQQILDAHVLVAVQVTPEMRVKAVPGPAPAVLTETGWVTFLVKVHNEAGTTAALRVRSPQAARLHGSPAETVADRWLDVSLVQAAPLKPELGGLPVEYRLVQIYSRDAGRREAKLIFDVGQGTQDLGFRSEVDTLFTCQPAHPVHLEVLDEHGKPTTGALLITDTRGHVFPAQSKRLAPDFSSTRKSIGTTANPSVCPPDGTT